MTNSNSKIFVDYQGNVPAAWLNDINNFVYFKSLPTGSAWLPTAANQMLYASSTTSLTYTNIPSPNQILTTNINGVPTFSSTLPAGIGVDVTGNGMVSNNGGALTGRTLTGTLNQIDVINGTGLLGNPTISIDPSYVGQSSITTLGTISTGVWNGTPITGSNIANNTITYSNLQSESATTFLGNPTGTPANVQEIGIGSTLAFVASKLETVAMTGDVTSSINSFSTTVAAIQGVTTGTPTGTGNVVFSTSPILITPNLGTPSSVVLTNATGTASGLTAGHVTTNANLTGPITSTGNATSVAAQTGTGSTFVMQASPSLTTPNLGTPSAGTLTNCSGNTTPTASKVAGFDANSNLSANNLIDGYTTTATAAGITTLTVSSTFSQYFTGTSTQTVKLPVTSTLVLGQQFQIYNLSTGQVTVQSSGANNIQILNPNSAVLVTCILTSGTTAASWNANYIAALPINKIVKQTFTSSGTYTPTTGMVYCIVEGVGGGGAGGGCASTSTTAGAGGGGGGGGYGRVTLTSSQIGASQTVTVGAAGAAGTAGNNPGNAGGSTSLGTLLSVGGGGGGAGTGSSSLPIAAAGGTAGTVTTGDVLIAGQTGGQGGSQGGSTALSIGGLGGNSRLGNGGTFQFGGNGGNNAGFAAQGGYGGGGGGACGGGITSSTAGGAGTGGIIIIQEFCSV